MKKILTLLLLIVIIAGIIYVWQKPESSQLLPIKQMQTLIKPTTISITKRYFGVNVSGPEFQNAMYTDGSYKGYQYFHSKGLTMIRIPFKWERLQPTLLGDLDSEQLNTYTNMIVSAEKAGESVIIEPHNFAQYNGKALTAADQNNFSDLWDKLAQKFKNNTGVWGYELMNEPHDIPGDCQTWQTLSQSAITAIRKTDTTHYILVPGYSWQSALDWQNASDCLKNLQDPADKLIYSAHEYFDEDKSGTYKSPCTDTTIGVTRAQPFLTWLAKNNKIGMFTEYGIPQDACWQTTLTQFMNTIYTNPNIIGGIYWAAGPFWGDYPLSV